MKAMNLSHMLLNLLVSSNLVTMSQHVSYITCQYKLRLFFTVSFYSPRVCCISSQSLVTHNSLGSARHSSLSLFFLSGLRRIILERWCSHKDLGSARNSWSLCERILTRQRQSETRISVRGRELDEIQSRS